MKLSDLDKKMRVFETAHDHKVLPGITMVVRLDGRGFTKLTKEVMKFEAPYDERFRDMMVSATKHLMDCGFKVLYGYTQSDEISLLLATDDDGFSRKERKVNSVLAGEASASITHSMGCHAVMDSRVCQLITRQNVVDYFRWRGEDALRNALNSHCYWIQRKEGTSAADATSRLSGLSVSEKNEFLFARGINFNDLPLWQKRGIGVVWEKYQKVGENPKTGEKVQSIRSRLAVDMELTQGDEYSQYVATIFDRQQEA